MLLGPLLVLAVLAVAAPRPQGTSTCAESSESSSNTSAVTIDATLTWTRTYTHTVTTEASSEYASSTSSAKMAAPTKPYNVISAQTGSLINAAGLSFHLGGDTASYCPDTVTENGGKCPPGDITALIGSCSMDAEVPGGQTIWATPDGKIGYTQAHSSSQPVGSVPCPFIYTKEDGEQFGHLSTNVFGASGLMACPSPDGRWQVFAALKNVTVPNSNISSCITLDARTMDYESSSSRFAAWQYI